MWFPYLSYGNPNMAPYIGPNYARRMELEHYDYDSQNPFRHYSGSHRTTEAAVESYMGDDLYGTMNRHLVDDSGLTRFQPYAMGINNYCYDHRPEDHHVYRGSRIPRSMHEKYQPGACFLDPRVLSTSRREDVARGFMIGDGDDVLFEYDLAGGQGFNARFGGNLSPYPGEEEVIFPPYSGFQVTKRERTPYGATKITLQPMHPQAVEGRNLMGGALAYGVHRLFGGQSSDLPISWRRFG